MILRYITGTDKCIICAYPDFIPYVFVTILSKYLLNLGLIMLIVGKF